MACHTVGTTRGVKHHRRYVAATPSAANLKPVSGLIAEALGINFMPFGGPNPALF